MPLESMIDYPTLFVTVRPLVEPGFVKTNQSHRQSLQGPVFAVGEKRHALGKKTLHKP
jgi:hypothetical protein